MNSLHAVDIADEVLTAIPDYQLSINRDWHVRVQERMVESPTYHERQSRATLPLLF
jgi:hypothetical protein